MGMSRFALWLRDLFEGREASDLPSVPEPTFEEMREQLRRARGADPANGGEDDASRGVQHWKLPKPSFSSTLVDANNDFAIALYKLLPRRNSNLVFSPFSIRAVLAMVLAGARGETAEQLSRAIRFQDSSENSHIAFGELLNWIKANSGGSNEMTVANSLWAQNGPPFQVEFLDVAARLYDCGMNLVDFRADPDAARVAINTWVEEKTNYRIREIISRGALDASTCLVLANAIHFKGLWDRPFQKQATREASFYPEGGRKVKVPLMTEVLNLRYVQSRGYKAVQIPYAGRNLSMLVLLPDRKDGIQDLEERLSPGLLNECNAYMQGQAVDVCLPRLRFTWGTADLREPLTNLGVRLAFDCSQADLSGLNGHRVPSEQALFVSSVCHKAFLEVNERGTEAAASSIGAIRMTACLGGKTPPIPKFRADHPFLFAILDRSGTILFLGRVADPTRA